MFVIMHFSDSLSIWRPRCCFKYQISYTQAI